MDEFNKWREVISTQRKRLSLKNSRVEKEGEKLSSLSKEQLIRRVEQLEFQLRQQLIN